MQAPDSHGTIRNTAICTIALRLPFWLYWM